MFIDNYILVDREQSGDKIGTKIVSFTNCTYVVQFNAGWCRIPSKLGQESIFLILNLLLAKELHCLIHSLIWYQWSAFQQTRTHCGHINDMWHVYPIFLWCILWNNNAWQMCKITQLMMIHGKFTMVAAVAFNIRSHTLILNLIYDTNMRSLKLLYDIWWWFGTYIFDK